MLHYVTLNHKAFGSWSTPQFEGGELKARALGLRSALESFSLTDLRLGGCWRCKARWKSWHIMAPVFLWFTQNSPLFLCMDKFAYGFLTVDFILSESRCISWKFLQHHIVLTAFTPLLPLFDTRADGDAAMRQGRENRQWFSRRWHGFLAAVCFFEPWTKEGHTDMRQSMAKPHEWSLWSIPHQQ